jgi:DNA-binding MarR family transcriptional regulator
MDLNLPFLHRGDSQFKVVSDDVVMLTTKGKDVADNQTFSGARAQVLMALNDNGSMSIKEIATDTRLPVDKVKAIVAELMRRAEVRKVGYEG